ncbi:MAG TPA: DNA double-strand break repair nuclease NurA [Anaerolineales bacterium]|jgi:hypothetical protein|nr:DNA double-strand break repair nuclease NurA [Anaerolineales bacterium]
MSLDFQQVRQQIQQLAEGAPAREERRRNLLEEADRLLTRHAMDLDYLREKVERAAAQDQYFRSAVPVSEALNDSFPLPDMPAEATLIAADGSQINPDRHLGIEYCLVNVGAIQMSLGQNNAPATTIQSTLYYGEELFSMQEKIVALIRDTREREILADLAEGATGMVVTFTDGPVELWGREVALDEEEVQDERNFFERYQDALSRLYTHKTITAGYVDRPRSDLVIRLLELAPDTKNAADARKNRWLRGILDTEILEKIIRPGERSAIFGLLSPTSKKYRSVFSLHFFYLNVSLIEGKPMLARVEVPAWVAQDPAMVDVLHAILVQQCQIVPTKQYPYLLTRADETAVVSMDEKEQVDRMIAQEMYKRGVGFAEKSQKQQSKEIARQKPHRKKGI